MKNWEKFNESNEKKDWFVKIYTSLVGTDEYYLFKNMTKTDVEEEAQILADEHYGSYDFDDDIESMIEDGMSREEAEEEVRIENSNYEIEVYDFEKHSDFQPELRS